MPVNLFSSNKAIKPINLFNNQQDIPQESIDPMEEAKRRIDEQYPNMPEWLKGGLLQLAPKATNPLIGSAARGFSKVTDVIPAAAGGLLQGASLPIRGVAGLIPNESVQKFADAPDLRGLFQESEGTAPKTAEMIGELAGAAGPLGMLFKGAKGLSALAKVPKGLQTPLALAETGALATQGDAKDRALGAAEALALGGAGTIAEKALTKAPKFLKGLMTKPNEELAVEAAQKGHDKLLSTADELYGQVRNAVKKRNIKVPVDHALIDEAAQFLPKSRAYKKLIENAKSGDYEAVHDLQSNLFKKGTKALSHEEPAISNQGEEIIDLRDRINSQLENELIKEGHLDVAHVLKQAKKSYAKLKDTYFDKNLKKSIGKLVHPETRTVPEKPLDIFKENSVPMKKFLDNHPEIAKQIKNEKQHELSKEQLIKALKAAGIGGGITAGTKSIYDLMK